MYVYLQLFVVDLCGVTECGGLFVAIEYFQEVLGISEGYHRAKEGMEKAQKLLKQSKKRDYYKILGVSRYVQYVQYGMYSHTINLGFQFAP